MASLGPDELPYLVAAVAILLSVFMMLQPKKSSGGASETVRVLLSCIRRAINSSMSKSLRSRRSSQSKGWEAKQLNMPSEWNVVGMT